MWESGHNRGKGPCLAGNPLSRTESSEEIQPGGRAGRAWQELQSQGSFRDLRGWSLSMELEGEDVGVIPRSHRVQVTSVHMAGGETQVSSPMRD